MSFPRHGNYKPDKDQPDEVRDCFSCDFETTCRAYKSRLRAEHEDEEERWNWYCPLCAQTVASSAHDYPTHYPDGGAIRLIAFVANHIFAALDGLREDG